MNYTITSVGDPRSWTGKFGPMLSYDLRLEGEQETVELAQKPTTQAPVLGQTIEGTIDRTGPHGPKLKKAQPMGGSGGGRPKDPDLDHRIARQVAFKGAIELVAASPPIFGEDDTKAPSLHNEVAIASVAALTEELLPIVEGNVVDARPSVKRVAKTLSGGPEKPQEAAGAVSTPSEGDGPVTKEKLAQAFRDYLDKAGPPDSVDREAAKKKTELLMASLGITSTTEMSDDQARQMYEALTT